MPISFSLSLSKSQRSWQILVKIMSGTVFALSFVKRIYLLLIYGLYLLSFDHKNSLFSLMKNNMLYLERADKPRAL